MGLTVVDNVNGLLVIGVWCCLPLFTLECVQAWTYFRNSGTKDRWLLYCTVLLVLAVDTATTIDQCAWIYYITVTKFLEGEAILAVVPPMLGIHDCLVMVTTFVCQFYLALRFLKLSKNRYIFVGLVVFSIAAQAMAVYTATLTWALTEFDERLRIFHSGEAWFSLEVATDWAISVSLIAYLVKFHRKTEFEKTKSLIVRIIVLTIESGGISSAVALAVIVSAVAAPLTNWCVLLLFLLGRVYGNTFLFNLNIRQGSSISGLASGSDDARGSNSWNATRSKNFPANSSFNMVPVGASDGVNVATTTHVHIEAMPPGTNRTLTSRSLEPYIEKSKYGEAYRPDGAHLPELDMV